MPHCEGSKDQCIKYQFFRPLHIFGVFQCSKHLDILATLTPVCACIGCVYVILWKGEITQIKGFSPARILFYPIPKTSPLWDIAKLLYMWKKKSGFHKWFHLDGYFRWWAGERAPVSGCGLTYMSRLCMCNWREDMALYRRRNSSSLCCYLGSGFVQCCLKHRETSIISLLTTKVRENTVIWSQKMNGRLMTESTSQQHRGVQVPAERSPHLCCGEGET